MTPPGPLGDDWLYWDPHAMESYPHSIDVPDQEGAAEQLVLFDDHEAAAGRSELARE